MKLVIDIPEYYKEWIYNACDIPEEIRGKITDAIDNGVILSDMFDRIKEKIADIYCGQDNFCRHIKNEVREDAINIIDEFLENMED